eukprot:g9493.t1
MQIVLCPRPNANDQNSMDNFHAYTHFYSIATGSSKNEQGFYQVVKNILEQLGEIEKKYNVKFDTMMDGVAFYKFFGVSAAASNITKHRGVAANVKKNRNILTCNTKHKNRWIKMTKILDPNFNIEEEIQCANSECDCLDWDIMKTTWKNNNLHTRNEEIRNATQLSEEYYLKHLSKLEDFIVDNNGTKNIMTRVREEGSSRGIAGSTVEKIMETLDKDITNQHSMDWLYKRSKTGSIQTSILGIMHLIVLGHGKSGILQELLSHVKPIAKSLKVAAAELAELNIQFLPAIKNSNTDGTFAIFQGDEILTLFYIWGFTIDNLKIRRLCFLLTAIYEATMANRDLKVRERLTKLYLNEFEVMFDHSAKKGTPLGQQGNHSAFKYNLHRDKRQHQMSAREKKILTTLREHGAHVHLGQSSAPYRYETKLYAMFRPNMLNLLAACKDINYVEANDRVFEGFIRKIKKWALRSNKSSPDYPLHIQNKFHMKKAIDGFFVEEDENRKHYATAKQYVDNIKSGDGGLAGKNFISGYFCIESKTFYAKYDKQFHRVVPVSIGEKFVFDLNPEFPVVNISDNLIAKANEKRPDGFCHCVWIKTHDNHYACVGRRLELLKSNDASLNNFEFVAFYEGLSMFGGDHLD